MLRTLAVIGLVLVATGPGVVTQPPPSSTQEPRAQALASVENVREILQRASTALSRSANQSCDVKHARTDVKKVIDAVKAAGQFLAAHPDALSLPPLPPGVTPDFAAPPRPAPQRNAMLESALKNLETAFQRFSEIPGGDLGGYRDKAYEGIDDAARNLMAAIKAANAAFREGRRELPDCPPEN